jgi:hypothetical protein
MVTLLILILYAIIILIYFSISFFIVYHLVKYSVDSQFKTVMLVFFVVISAGLFLTNLALFFSVNWNALISNLITP